MNRHDVHSGTKAGIFQFLGDRRKKLKIKAIVLVPLLLLVGYILFNLSELCHQVLANLAKTRLWAGLQSSPLQH